MAKTANINLRIEPQVKRDAEALFESFGISVTDAINIFLHQSIIEQGFPFAIQRRRYNAETEAALQEARDILCGKIPAKSYGSAKELFADVDLQAE